LLAYTPLKKNTSLATLVGAVPGAIPPLIGWAAAGGGVTFPGLILFFILFFWQLPHFLAIAWMYRSDYERAGFPMLSVMEGGSGLVSRQMILYLAALLPVSLLPAVFGFCGLTYFLGSLALGISFSGVVIFSASNLDLRARYVLRASVVYLAAVLILMVFYKV
jgi:protoheme IX farnesyltransferase